MSDSKKEKVVNGFLLAGVAICPVLPAVASFVYAISHVGDGVDDHIADMFGDTLGDIVESPYCWGVALASFAVAGAAELFMKKRRYN